MGDEDVAKRATFVKIDGGFWACGFWAFTVGFAGWRRETHELSARARELCRRLRKREKGKVRGCDRDRNAHVIDKTCLDSDG